MNKNYSPAKNPPSSMYFTSLTDLGQHIRIHASKHRQIAISWSESENAEEVV